MILAGTRKSQVLITVLAMLLSAGCKQENVNPPQTGEASAEQPPPEQVSDSAGTAPPAIKAPPAAPDELPQSILFKQVAATSGIQHSFQSGAKGELLMFESIGGGVGWIDVQRDGLLDLFCVQGGDATIPGGAGNPSDEIFLQSPGGHFSKVGEKAGLIETAYGQGVIIGDFDNDGFDDIFTTTVGRNQLWHNCGDGSFLAMSSAECCSSNRWSSSAAWADVDLDGDLDLYVCNYLKYDPFSPFPCEKDGRPALCHPRQIEAWPDEYFRNEGDGTFVSMASELGLYGKGNKALGVVVTDLSGDRFPDIYVANDTTSNFYFVNQQDGTFKESSLALGGGMNAAGNMQASMGVAAGDYDRNGLTDLLLTHFTGESNTLYQNMGELGLHDVTGKTRLFPTGMQKLGFGVVMADFDANGEVDLAVANGHIDSNHADGDGFRQKAQVLTFATHQWQDVSATASSYFSEEHVGRGMAIGDYGGDGDMDLAIANQNEPMELLENTSSSGSWLKVVPLPRSSNRSGIGLSVTVTLTTGQWSGVIPGGTSFASSHEHAVFIGCGKVPESETASVRITWPSGQQTESSNISLNQIFTVREP